MLQLEVFGEELEVDACNVDDPATAVKALLNQKVVVNYF